MPNYKILCNATDNLPSFPSFKKIPLFHLSINGKIKCPLLGEEESLDREEKIKRKT